MVHLILHEDPVEEGGESKYLCPLCRRAFLKDSLMNHVKTHTGERPFLCQLCDLR
jgi:formate dehydrogenase maturation protein FdhE